MVIPFYNVFLRYKIMKTKIQHSLTRAEEDIMQIIWKLETCLVRDIIDHLGQPDMPHSTVSSVVRILERKGFVTHKAYGKTHEYRAAISKEEYAQQNVKSLIKKYFSDSPSQLVNFILQKTDLDLSEFNELKQSLLKSKQK